jgi:hypothetical protein
VSKTVGKILAVAAVVVAIAAIPVTGGGSLAVAAGITGATASTLAVVAAAIAAASLVNSLLLAGQMAGANQQRQAAETRVQLGEGPRKAIVGRAATAGTLSDAFNFGGQYGTDWEVLDLILADHRCDALEGFFVNDKYMPFAGDGVVAGYNGQLEVHWRAGTEDQSPPALMTTHGGATANDRLRGVAHVVVAYKADDPSAKNPVWTAGRPSFLFVVRGLRLYDPRKDSTVSGGSGPHRWDDPATREWGENAEVCRYNFDRGIFACDRVTDPTQLLIGRGLSAIEAPPERIFAAANVCDETVPALGSATEPRYRVGGVIAADETFATVADAFAAAMGGIVIQPEGSVAVEPGQAKAPSFFFTDADIISGTKVGFSPFRSEADKEWVNTVAPRYVEPTQKWADHGAPVRRVAADVIADRGPREATPSLRLVTSGTQAQRIGEILRKQGRLLKTASVTLGPRFAEIEEGDWGVWTSDRRLKGESRTFRVDRFALGRDWRTALTLREMSADVYAAPPLYADGAVAEQQVPVTDPYYLPPRTAFTLVSRTPAYPWSTTSSSISVAAFTGTLTDTRTIAFPARTFSGLASGAAFMLFWNLDDEDYRLVTSTAGAAQMAIGDNVVIASLFTAGGDGTYPEDDVPPGTRGGGGGGNGTAIP